MPKCVPRSKKGKWARENMSILSFFTRLDASSDKGKEMNQRERPSSSNALPESGKCVLPPGPPCGDVSKHLPENECRKCPKYKWLKGAPFTVDAFKYGAVSGCIGYFLTHFHYDHYGGMSTKFEGTVFCSEVTARLVRVKFGQSISLVPLPTNIFTRVHDCDILLIDANHCPGSVMILCRPPNGEVSLHTGDFRAHANMLQAPSALADFVQNRLSNPRIDTIFLDTTFCAPQYAFPQQDLVIAAAVEISREALLRYPNALVLCGMYTIGKERFVVSLAEQLEARVWLPAKQRGLVTAAAEGGCEVCRRLLSRTVTTSSEARVHVVDMGRLNPRAVLASFMPTGKPIIAWKPSGWMYNPRKRVTDPTLRRLPCTPETFLRLRNCISVEMIAKTVYVFGASYSEHSSFIELKEFITKLKPMKVQPTVFGGAAKDARKHIDGWLRSDEAADTSSNKS
uniref:DNA repair metallo-beta-lactamase domain-containing protein n=1 Tax=Echinococcus canadensis TaxID=519352 RepID=A0A915EZY7_9CEST